MVAWLFLIIKKKYKQYYMEKDVLIALWDKTNDVFMTKADAVANFADKVDIATYNESESARTEAEAARVQAEYERVENYNILSGQLATAIESANTSTNEALSAASLATSAANRVDTAIEQAETVNAVLSGTVVTITDKEGESRSVDLAATTDEAVWITVTTSVPNVDVSGLTINAYYNGSTAVTTSVTTDNNGMAVLYVPNTYTYKLVFPNINGCKEITPISHTASVSQRSIEVEYVAYGEGDFEQVTVYLQAYKGESVTKLSGITVSATVEGNTSTYETNSSGIANFSIQIGKQYTVKVPSIEGLYLHGDSSKTFTADTTSRGISFYYRYYQSGLFIVDTGGTEYTKDEWETALSAGTVNNGDAVLIKVATSVLINNSGVFGVSIDALRERTEPTRAWNPNNAQFNSIPLNGNNTSQPYYYDGKTASELIQNEGNERNLDTPAVDYAMASGRSINGLSSFLGSVGQWAQLWANRIEVDDLLVLTRPNGSYLFSTYTTNKWTSTQASAAYAWRWTSVAYSNDKYGSCVVVPFFAFDT